MNCNKTVVYIFSFLVTPLMLLLIYNYMSGEVVVWSQLAIVSLSSFSLSNLTITPYTNTDHLNNITTLVEVAKPPKLAEKDVLPDCMELRKTKPYPSQGTHIKGSDLCAAFQGTSRTDCVYNHPEVFNFVLFTDNPDKSVLDFQSYLAIYSVHKFYKPDKVVIHCNNEIRSNVYWEKLKKLSTPLETKLIKRIHTIGKAGSIPGFITHEADYFKVSHGFKHGGIFADFDIVVLNGTKLREMQRRSEIIMGRDDTPCSRTCAGFISCVPGSPLMRKWLDSYENDYKPHEWVYNAGDAPSNLLKSCTECYDAIVDMDISNWNEAFHWNKAYTIKWRKIPVAHYMNTAFMKPLKPVKEILKMSTSFAEMVKCVLGDTAKDLENID